MFCLVLCRSATCPTGTSATPSTTSKFSASGKPSLLTPLGFSTNYFYDIRVGSSTGSFYYFGEVYSTYNAIIVKTDSSGSVAWGKVFYEDAYYTAFEVDPSETYIFYTDYASSNFPLHRIATSNGAASPSKQITSFYAGSSFVTLRFATAASTLFTSGQSTTSRAEVCATGVSAWTSAQCVVYAGLKDPATVLPLSSSDVLVVSREATTPYPIHFVR